MQRVANVGYVARLYGILLVKSDHICLGSLKEGLNKWSPPRRVLQRYSVCVPPGRLCTLSHPFIIQNRIIFSSVDHHCLSTSVTLATLLHAGSINIPKYHDVPNLTTHLKCPIGNIHLPKCFFCRTRGWNKTYWERRIMFDGEMKHLQKCMSLYIFWSGKVLY